MNKSGDKAYCYGIDGLANHLHCSKRTAHRIKASGKINEAIIQVGHIILVDKKKVDVLLARKEKN
ncbi:DUF3853 family protein [Cruoricaptor ignavus]|uniref:DUF3853 family protein n=1 Tax=Cruoricaptor ignavus TaxID=1118202 RepID=A0A7M1T6N4_9FLAO|nr:DUF3853 family protein [Cruoricaptor ignavus]QOR74633.1 DUF3853 family protein [Cruoricaptor ignavus]